jgi:putative transposase
LAHSLGTIGDAFDNAAVESFWARMQTGLLDTDAARRNSTGFLGSEEKNVSAVNTQKWMTRVKLSTAIFDWAEVFYNHTQRHSSLGMLSPAPMKRLHGDHTSAA